MSAVRRYVEASWGQVHIREAGDPAAREGIVLLHESPLSGLVYEPVLPLLGRSWRAVALDTPGYGSSDPPPDEREIPHYAAVLLEAVTALGIERFVAVGCHTGASLALQMALQASDRAVGLVLTGIPVLSAGERDRYLATWAPEVNPDPSGAHLRWAWERYERIWEGPAELLHLGATLLLGNLGRYHWAYNAAFRYDPEPDLPRVSCPIRFVTAERDLLIAADREAARRLEGARLVEVPGLHGQLPLRAPERFAEEVLRFCDEVRIRR
jgi:pimeloyl-ACP methyl ester carboxylesterase